VLDLKISAMIPEDYIENPDLRLSLYRKIASAKDIKALTALAGEIRDRFGEPPEKTGRLIEIMELKALAKKLLVTRLINSSGKIRIFFAAESAVTPETILALYSSGKVNIRFLPEGGIELDLRGRRWDEIFAELKGLMEGLAPGG
ncbi:MAG: hypothetical protein OEU95_06460, partial [Nitrospirota bacterium]|nr:hypothetical protein [Nitrospirota bacterium]